MKNKNYYSIHKNKKKRKSTLTDFQKVWKSIAPTIIKAMIICDKLIKSVKDRNIPKYSVPNKGNYKGSETMIVNDIHKEILYESEKANVPVDLQEYFDPNLTINLPDNIPLNIGYEKNSYQEFKNRSFEM